MATKGTPAKTTKPPTTTPKLSKEEKEDPSFFVSDTIIVNLEDFKEYFNNLIITGSQRFRLERSDLHVYGTEADMIKEDLFSVLMKNGTPFFDAIIFISLPGEKKSLLIDPKEQDEDLKKSMTYVNVSRALYLFYFLLLTRGSVGDEKMSVVSKGGKKSQIPAFLSKVMNFEGTIGDYRNIISSFSLTKIPPTWVKYIRIKDLGTETRQRLTLQIAGHRMFKPFLYIDPLGPKAAEYEEQVTAIRNFINLGATWDIFTPTRSAQVAQKLGPLNANLGNLLLEVYTDDQITEMVDNSLIAIKPEFRYGFANYKTYDADSFAEFTDYIF